MAHRKAARVLPEPVGAHSRVCSPRAIGPQAPVCAAVGSGKDVSNQERTGAENCERAPVESTSGLYRRGMTAKPRN